MKHIEVGHHATAYRVCLIVSFALLCGIIQGCQSAWMPTFGSPSMGAGMPPPQLRPPPIVVKTPDANWNIGILELEDFVPNGSRVIETGAGIPRYFEEGKARFASSDQQTFSSPDGRSSLLLESAAQKRGKGLWLVLRSRGVQNSEPIIISERPIEVLWSPLSDTFAVNHWADPNACDVFTVVIGNAQRTFFDLTPLLNLHFPSEGIALRRVAKAHRWTTNGDLVMRALFQQMEEPYSVFGCEVQVALSSGTPSLSMLRGFIKD